MSFFHFSSATAESSQTLTHVSFFSLVVVALEPHSLTQVSRTKLTYFRFDLFLPFSCSFRKIFRFFFCVVVGRCCCLLGRHRRRRLQKEELPKVVPLNQKPNTIDPFKAYHTLISNILNLSVPILPER